MNAGGCCAIFFPTGYVSDVVIRNNTVDHLKPLDESSFPGYVADVESRALVCNLCAWMIE